jgi:hypothetical protein
MAQLAALDPGATLVSHRREKRTNLVVARVYFQSSSHGDTTAQGEEGVDAIETGIDQVGANRLEGTGDEEEQTEHAEDGHKDGVVDFARVAIESIVDHVAGQCHDEEGPEELWNVNMRLEWDGFARRILTSRPRRPRPMMLDIAD